MHVDIPLRPNGKPVPSYLISKMTYVLGYPIFLATDWYKDGARGRWICGYCQKRATDLLSANTPLGAIEVNCNHCDKTNRIGL